MIQFLQDHAVEILVGIGIVALLVGPKIKEALAAGGGGEASITPAPPPPPQASPCECQCEEEEEESEEEESRESIVNKCLAIREWLEDMQLKDSLASCNKLVTQILEEPPQRTITISTTKSRTVSRERQRMLPGVRR